MSIFTTSRYALSFGAGVALLAGCGGSQPPLSMSSQGLAPQQWVGSQAYSILHEFRRLAGRRHESDGGTHQRQGHAVWHDSLWGL